jgi:MarC family membrane protein
MKGMTGNPDHRMNSSLLINFTAALFAIIDPLGNLPLFLSFTQGQSRSVQRFLALFISGTIFVLLLFFLFSGSLILKFFGISLAAFRIAGGILLLLISIDMIRGERTHSTLELAERGRRSSFHTARNLYRQLLVPLVIPLFVGPGSISTVVLYSTVVRSNWLLGLELAGCLLLIATITFAMLAGSHWFQRLLGDFGLEIITRLLGVILGAIGVQFILGGLADSTVNLINPRILE